MKVISLPDGRAVPPDNRWDLIVETSAVPPLVSVVIPYYDQQKQLSLVLEALTAQTYPADRIEVVIADDGSARPPDVERWLSRLDVIVMRQEDKGFRAAAARNLGADAARGSILCFLDADTVPTPGYIHHAVRLPAAAPDVVVVGRRLHADLSRVAADSVVGWIADNTVADGPHDSEPRWLVDAYQRTANLLTPGWDGYKYLISAVFTCTRELFDDVGGFDPSFIGYGGEDWELANRAFMMGAIFAHEPKAIAWHDGPDWGQRAVPDRLSHKNAEALALAPLITDPAARTAGLRYSIPDIAVVIATGGHTAASLLQTISGVLSGLDCGVWLLGAEAESLHRALGIDDSRVRVGSPEPSVTSRSRFYGEVNGRLLFSPNTLELLTAELSPGGAGQVTVDFEVPSPASVTFWSSRARHRARRWSDHIGWTDGDLVDVLFGVRRIDSTAVGIVVCETDPSLAW